MEIKEITIDGFAEYIGIDQIPTISWKLEGLGENAFQKSYRIKIQTPDGNILDTEKVESSCHMGIELKDIRLKSFEKYQFQVIVEDLSGDKTESEWVTFVTGAVNPDDFKGKWIGTGSAKPFYARKECFVSKKIESAYAAVCGLGQFLFYVNGKKVGSHELDPGWTNYDKRAQYVTFDIKEYLQAGENAVGISVGNGFYLADKGDRYFFEMPPAAMKAFMPPNANGYKPYGNELPLKAMILIQYADGESSYIATDTDWKVQEGACILANVYGSEVYDARRYQEGWNRAGFQDKSWMDAREVHGPAGKLSAQGQPPVIVKKTYEAVLVEKQTDGYLYDFGQNMSCMLELKVEGNAGDQVDLLVAEKLDGNGNIDQIAKNWDNINVSCTYILAGTPGGETWRQQFSYVGARYVLIKCQSMNNSEKLPVVHALKGHYIVSDSPVTASFFCDNEKMNQVYWVVTEAIDSNLKSVHTDCPSIEKTAWLEASHLMAPSIMFYRDVRGLWRKLFEDEAVEQYTAGTSEFAPDGSLFYRGAGFLPAIAPAYGKFTADAPMGSFWDLIVWGSFLILGCRWYWMYYGDKSVIGKYYQANKNYLDYLESRKTRDGFIAHGLGDWGNPAQGSQATANIETAFYYYDLVVMSEFAVLLDRPADQQTFLSLAEEIRSNYNHRLLVQKDGKWCYKAWDHQDEIFCTQACQALPLYFGMVPEEARTDVADMLNRLTKDGFVSGEIGMPAILHSLQSEGYQATLMEAAFGERGYNYSSFVENGFTTLGEYWEDNPRSHNHDMMGSILEWYFNGMTGIQILEPGFSKIKIQPELPNTVNHIVSRIDTVQGLLDIQIERCAGAYTVYLQIPAGMRAELDLLKLGKDEKHCLCPGKYTISV